MKKAISFLALFTLIFAHAQWKVNFDKEDKNNLEDQKRFSYGYFLGLNSFDFKVHPKISTEEYELGQNEYGGFNIETNSKIGFSAGLMGKMKLSQYFDVYIQPGVHFVEREIIFNNIEVGETYAYPIGVDKLPLTATEEHKVRNVKSSYIDIPLMLQIHGDRWFNTRPYFQAGLGYAINLQSNESSEDDNEDNIFRLTTHGYNWQVEGGISIYFRRFKLTPSVKGIFFMNNELVADDPETLPIWAGSMKSLHTRAIMFSLKFE